MSKKLWICAMGVLAIAGSIAPATVQSQALACFHNGEHVNKDRCSSDCCSGSCNACPTDGHYICA